MKAEQAVSPKRAHFALGVLTLINFLNYLDRYLVASILPDIEKAFALNHTQAGIVGTIFVLVYLAAAPLGGFLGDRMSRKLLVAISVGVWSLATVASGIAPTFAWLLGARAVIGVGEAGYGTVTPSIISDLYPREQRTRMLSIFYVAMPAGAAAGFALGGWVAATWSWHAAFFVGGVPGLLLAVLSLVMPEPVRGAKDVEPTEKVPFLVGLKGLGRNGIFWTTTIGLTLMTFSVGGLGYWIPSFLISERHFDPKWANTIFGGVTALAGILGTLAGGWMGERAERRSPIGGLVVSGIGLLGAAPLLYFTALAPTAITIYSVVFAAQFLIWINTGPLNAAIVNCVSPTMRSFAMGLNVLFIHLFGDALSPYLIGVFADRFSLGTAVELNAVPVLLGGAVLVIGARALHTRSVHRPLPSG